MKYAGLALVIFGVVNGLLAIAVLLAAVWGAWPPDSGLDPLSIGTVHGGVGLIACLLGGGIWVEYS